MQYLEALAKAVSSLDDPTITKTEIVTEGETRRLWLTSTTDQIFKVTGAQFETRWEVEGTGEDVMASCAIDLVASFKRALTNSVQPKGPLYLILRNVEFLEALKTKAHIDPVLSGTMQPFSKTLFLGYAFDFPDRIEGLYTAADLPADVGIDQVYTHAFGAFSEHVAMSGIVNLDPVMDTGFHRLRLDGSFDASRMLLHHDWDLAAEALNADLNTLIAIPLCADVLVFGVVGSDTLPTLDACKKAGIALADQLVTHGGAVLSTGVFALRDGEITEIA